MKTIGLVGGTGWISSIEYYRIINEETNRRLGGLEFAKCILYSVNYAEIDRYNKTNNKEGVYNLIHQASIKLAFSGADCIVLCVNTLHQFVDKLELELDVPIVHIATATASQIKQRNINQVGLLGTRQTMEMDFYKSRLKENGIEVLVPEINDRNFIQQTILSELIKGLFLTTSRVIFVSICNDLINQGAEGIIMGCTEIPLLLKQDEVSVPLFDTLTIHAMAAVDFALEH
ncbi:MAG: aspartate racemase [Bacteroidetes bacterium GWF2_33_16]|nr:MAG: aspartate racemase [Bacteroidetes bacterium GWE2_32_14]OFY04028.1 MAG: aspartate racemase [Bacteroidetes bacterium GWF2_33_16]